jgi:peptide/nickel transport system permease protein
MAGYIGRRLIYMIFSIWALSVVVFIIIQLPPGDYLTTYVAALQAQGTSVDPSTLQNLRIQYGLSGSMPEQYIHWITKFMHGDMGQSFAWQFRPVADLLKERLPYSVIVSVFALIFTYVVAVPIGIYAATHQYSIGDYLMSILGFVGLATPNFMLALILLYLFFRYFDISVGGLFSPGMSNAPWTVAKLWDFVKHLWIPIIVIGMSGTAGLIRVMRGTLLDELGRQYVITARAKGVPEGQLLFKYPVRVALNPVISTIGWQLPHIVSGETIVSIVLALPTTGPLVFNALIAQDMFMAGSIVMLLGILTLVGTLLSDILLVIVDPRIRFEKKA